MGFVSQMIGSFGQKVKHWIGSGIQYGRKAADMLHRGLGKVTTFLDEVLETAHNYPILTDLATQLEENSYYQGFRDIVDDLEDVLAQSNAIFDGVEHVLTPVAHIPNDGFIDEFDRDLPNNPIKPLPGPIDRPPRTPLPGLPA